MKKVLVAGELNVDIVLQGYHSFHEPGKEVLVDDCLMVLGSASAICAMGLLKLGDPVAFLGKVGDDPWGRFCVECLAERGADVSRVMRDPGIKTGVTVAITSPRDRALVSFLGSIAALGAEDVHDAAFAGFSHLHVSSYYLQERLRPGLRSLFARARRLGLTTSLDPGFDPSETWAPDLGETLSEVDVFFPNEVELRGLTGTDDPGEALRRLQNGRTRTVAKLGRDGAATLEGGQLVRVASYPIEPLDTTGAGDSFNAGFLHAWLAGSSSLEALRLGAACGALSMLLSSFNGLAQLGFLTIVGVIVAGLVTRWVLPALTVLQAIFRLRAICEHGAVRDTSSPLTAARTHLPGLNVAWALARPALFPHHVNYHVEHHLYPAVPHYNLRRLHNLLVRRGLLEGAEVRAIDSTMRTIFADPARPAAQF
jgi:sugar/nucleoside kinase (ribokinase family)